MADSPLINHQGPHHSSIGDQYVGQGDTALYSLEKNPTALALAVGFLGGSCGSPAGFYISSGIHTRNCMLVVG